MNGWWADSSSPGCPSLGRKSGKSSTQRKEKRAGSRSSAPLASRRSAHSSRNFPNSEHCKQKTGTASSSVAEQAAVTQPGSKAGPFSEKGGANEQRRLSFSGDRREDDPTAPRLGTTVRLGGAVTEHAGVSARLARGCPSLGLSLTRLHPSHGTTEMKTSTAKAARTTEAGETCEAQSARQEPSR